VLVAKLEEADVKRSVWVQLLTGVATTGTIGALMAACAHDDSTIFIQSVQAPPAAASPGAACVYTPDPGGAFISTGVLDVALLATYTAEALIGNQLISQGNHDLLRTETARVTLQGATVRLTDASGAQLKAFTTLSSGFVNPGNGSAPSFGNVAVTLVDAGTSDALRTAIPRHGSKLLVAYFKVFGTTLGGQSVETDEFQFPINVCNGCLPFFPNGSQDEALFAIQKPTRNCLAASMITGGIPCIIGQDQAVDCRLCKGFQACDPSIP
jgi:hypothetical protein